MTSKDHIANVEEWFARNHDDKEIKVFLNDYYVANPDEEGGSVSEEDKLYRYRVVEAMLSAGIPLAKVDQLRPLLERADRSLTGSQHLRVFIPKIEEREIELLKKEVKGQRVTVIFDGTTRLGEAIVILLRWIPASFDHVEQRLVAFRTAFAHTSGVELAQLINAVLFTTLGLRHKDIVGDARDSCATNGVALRTLKALLTHMQDFMCISHTLSHTGEHVELSTLDAW